MAVIAANQHLNEIASPKNYVLAKARLYLWEAAAPEKVSAIGDIESVEVGRTAEFFEYEESIHGKNQIVKKIPTKTTSTGTFETRDITTKNMKLYLWGENETDVSQASGTVVTAQDVEMNYEYFSPLGKTKVSAVVVKNAGETVTYVEGTDYIVRPEEGMIAPIDGGAIVDGATCKVTYAYAADPKVELVPDELSAQKRHIRILGNTPEGKILEIVGYGSISPTGNMPMHKRDNTWMNMQFEIGWEKHLDYSTAGFKVYDHGWVS